MGLNHLLDGMKKSFDSNNGCNGSPLRGTQLIASTYNFLDQGKRFVDSAIRDFQAKSEAPATEYPIALLPISVPTNRR